ncbi:hypothetical protein [Natrinema pallidum]|uniref:Uncharacterized protein n=2 Tax=Natrinema pallidum TaxID=69527 RepID=L9YU62_9EURY|nr:hypothetical protein [Natrinema pallidum]ELY77669.1 hypothetical protein C487_09593 [Natrinema pallidum DSM 3751]QCW04250.1 hypothetical protein FGF80_13870 [Natrinema pallidum]
MSLATSGVTAGIVLFNLTSGIAAVASVMLSLFVLVVVLFAVAPLFSSTWIGQQDVTAAGASRSTSSDD